MKNYDSARPHSPYLEKLETLDSGFSKNWMPHFLPCEEYWVDTHAHLSGITDDDNLKHLIDAWFAKLDAFRLGKIVAISEQAEMFNVLENAVKTNERFAWLYWPRIDKPSVKTVRSAVQAGACGLKLHNKDIMEGKAPRAVYQSSAWQEVLAYAESEGLPILWHVTQRHGYSPYHGGGLNAYWKNGWPLGVKFTNEDLLSDVLETMEKFPELKIIGAHQLHIGPDRLCSLFETHKNLYIDSSCGMYLRWADDFMEADRIVLRDFVEQWSDRIIFGTDADIKPGSLDEYAVQSFLCHARFILKLGLSDDALQNVAWRTANLLYGFRQLDSARRGNVRP